MKSKILGDNTKRWFICSVSERQVEPILIIGKPKVTQATFFSSATVKAREGSDAFHEPISSNEKKVHFLRNLIYCHIQNHLGRYSSASSWNWHVDHQVVH